MRFSITKVYSPKLLALRGGRSVKFPDKRRHVTLEWPLTASSTQFNTSELHLCLAAVKLHSEENTTKFKHRRLKVLKSKIDWA